MKELKRRLEWERKKGLGQKKELQKQAADLQALRDKSENLERECDHYVEQAKDALDEMEVTVILQSNSHFRFLQYFETYSIFYGNHV